MRLVLLGDGDSPHLLKWARALAPRVELWALSSRGFAPGFDAAVPPARRLALGTQPRFEGGNAALLLHLPRVAAWLKAVRPDWIHAHYLTSHGTLAWLATTLLGAPGALVGSAWGSDILVTPQRSRLMRWLTRRVLQACRLGTSDSQVMAQQMQVLGAGEVMTFPFGLEQLPLLPAPDVKQTHLVFANRGLEPIYDPLRVLRVFAALRSGWPDAQLVVAHDGSLRADMQRQAEAAGLGGHVRFIGRVDAAEQARWYAQARWYLSLPRSDSVSVSVLEAMAHGCIPILSDLPANRELVQHRANGWIAAAGDAPSPADLQPLLQRADAIARRNHAWVAQHAMFGPCVEAFVARLQALQAAQSPLS
jgi:L-malate glycosyltransferase